MLTAQRKKGQKTDDDMSALSDLRTGTHEVDHRAVFPTAMTRQAGMKAGWSARQVTQAPDRVRVAMRMTGRVILALRMRSTAGVGEVSPPKDAPRKPREGFTDGLERASRGRRPDALVLRGVRVEVAENGVAHRVDALRGAHGRRIRTMRITKDGPLRQVASARNKNAAAPPCSCAPQLALRERTTRHDARSDTHALLVQPVLLDV